MVQFFSAVCGLACAVCAVPVTTVGSWRWPSSALSRCWFRERLFSGLCLHALFLIFSPDLLIQCFVSYIWSYSSFLCSLKAYRKSGCGACRHTITAHAHEQTKEHVKKEASFLSHHRLWLLISPPLSDFFSPHNTYKTSSSPSAVEQQELEGGGGISLSHAHTNTVPYTYTSSIHSSAECTCACEHHRGCSQCMLAHTHTRTHTACSWWNKHLLLMIYLCPFAPSPHLHIILHFFYLENVS